MNSQHKFFRIFTLCTFFIFFGIFTGWSQSAVDAIRIMDNQIGFGARAMGMGGAYTGIADDYSAVFWNPAGLAQIPKMEFWMGISHLHFSNESNLNGSIIDASLNATKFNSLGMVFPIPTYRGSLVFALGYQKVKDFEYINDYFGVSDRGELELFDVDPNDPDQPYYFSGQEVQKEGLATDEGNMSQYTFSGAIDVAPNISVGASIFYWKGRSDYTEDFRQLDIYDNFIFFPADFDEYVDNSYITDRYSSFGLKLSSLFRLGKDARVGIGMHIPQTFNIKEEWGYNSTVYFDNGDFLDYADDDEFEYEVQIPFRFQAGGSVALGNILGAANLEYIDWTQFEFQTSEFRQENIDIRRNYRGTLMWNVGAEIGIPLMASQIRAGFMYKPSPLADAQSEFNRKYITVGYGLLYGRIVKVDLAYMYGFWKQITGSDISPQGITEEDIKYHKLLLTFSYRF
ncbi:MAG: hypothetical protein EH225_12260 [Calditrichaeota bacterium]|nr:outer membrane protein transport protein [Calditrichota bacterium]RQV92473.1 MAG: hypothetical protein EH221_11470 [bacterium]RQV99003.1 MAG: hypothetical protein EH225_12260 [Calditrichota bacterium]